MRGEHWWKYASARCAIIVVVVGITMFPAGVQATAKRNAAQVAVLPPPSAYVFDLSAGAVSKSERVELVRPIASLTKLMTAMVLLDADVNLERSITYDPKRHYAYKNWMHFGVGDRLSGRDLLLATLVGSQNITARMLVHLTPYTERAFIDRMNKKAATLGLTKTHFTDVHGLSPRNVSTAMDVAKMFSAAMEYPDIRGALERSEAEATVVFRNGRSRVAKFSHTNVLLKHWQAFATEASKTGYIDEAGDTIAMRIRDPRTGRRFLVVTLGEPRSASRFRLAKQLAERAIRGTARIAGAK